MTDAELASWEASIVSWLRENTPEDDPAHDICHLMRVWRTARSIAKQEADVDLLVVLAASLLHDVVNVPKDSPDRSKASRLSAERAVSVLRDMGFPEDRLGAVAHVIEAHSFSAGVEPRTIEACVVQDADRLDSLGAIGIARCFMVSGLMRRPIADGDDPIAENRCLDDQRFALDHFALKLLRLPDSMRTEAGRRRAHERASVLVEFRDRLAAEIRGEA